MLRICKNCGKEFDDDLIDSSKFPKDYCCYSCYETWVRFNYPPNCECSVCGKPMYMKPSRLKRLIHSKITCSKDCCNKLRVDWMSGEENHQFGLKGDLNSSFKGNETINNGYIYEYRPDHPKADNRGRVRQHRLVVEDNWKNYDEKYFSITENGLHILKDEFDVHHINEIKTDNRVENLQILTRGEHSSYHCLKNPQERNKITGKFAKK